MQKQLLGLKKTWGSPNGAMRRGWNGITISRDTIHIEGMELGYKNPVLFERHAIGGEYGAGYKTVGAGHVVTTFKPENGGSEVAGPRTTSSAGSITTITRASPPTTGRHRPAQADRRGERGRDLPK